MRRTYGRDGASRPTARDLLQSLRYFVSVSARYSAFALVPVSSATTPAAGRARAPPRRPAVAARPAPARAGLVDLGATDDEHDLAARPLLGVARGELRSRAAHDLLVDLGQLAADGHRPLGIDRRQHGQRRADPARRLEGHHTSGERRPPPARRFLRGRKPTKRHVAAASPRHERGQRRAGPGQHLDLEPGRHARLHEHEAGIADERHPGIADQRHHRAGAHPLHELAAPAPLGVLVVAHALGRHPVAVEQHPRGARVLAGDDVGVAQRAEARAA